MGMNICIRGEYEEVEYTKERWMLLDRLRVKALELMDPLVRIGVKPFVYGSIARGDVDRDSDIDVVILYNINPSIVESVYQSSAHDIVKKYIVQATPTYTPKVYLWFDLSGRVMVSFPLARLRSREEEFYRFGGLLGYNDLKRGLRVPGVDKRLMLINPTGWGHTARCIIGREGEASRILGISESTVLERVNVLTRREHHGRTGVFLEVEVEGEILDAVKQISERNKFFRMRLGLG